MDVRSLVIEAGDLVSGSGQLIADADGEWLDLPHSIDLGWRPGPRPRSRHAVRVTGADVDAVPTEWGPGSDHTIPGWVDITGIWREDLIEIRSQSPVRQGRDESPQWVTPPCPPPAGGWPRGLDASHNLSFDLGDLETTGAAVGVVTFRPSADQGVLVVSATDIAAVEAVLRPQLRHRLCVVPSRWTKAQIDDVRAGFDGHWEDWHLLGHGAHTDERAQVSVTAMVDWVTSGLADWADGLPEGILTVEPSLTPIRAT
jgi:hypothetical protein